LHGDRCGLHGPLLVAFGKNGMKRFLIFTVLFPPLTLVIYIASDPVWRREPPEMGFLLWMSGFAYLFAVIPAWLTAGMDWALSAKPFYLRLVSTMGVAAIMAELTAHYLYPDMRELVLTVGLMGAIPAALCSWLSALVQPEESANA
jgi:hypothetical protein